MCHKVCECTSVLRQGRRDAELGGDRLRHFGQLCDRIVGGVSSIPKDFPKLFGLAASGQLRLEEMAGPDYPLDEVNEAFEALASGRAVRPRVRF